MISFRSSLEMMHYIFEIIYVTFTKHQVNQRIQDSAFSLCTRFISKRYMPQITERMFNEKKEHVQIKIHGQKSSLISIFYISNMTNATSDFHPSESL